MVTSATLDSDKFSAYYGGCPVLTVPGRCHSVTVVHAQENHERDHLQVRSVACQYLMPSGHGTGKVAWAFMRRVWLCASLSAKLDMSWVDGWQSLEEESLFAAGLSGHCAGHPCAPAAR